MRIYEGPVRPTYVEIDEPVIKPGGIIVRRGLYRDGTVGANYVAQVCARPDNDSCVFCEPRLTDEQDITQQGEYFTAFSASAPYEFFGDHPVGEGGHELVVPTSHTDTPGELDWRTVSEMNEYLRGREKANGAITFVRSEGNPSKSVQHLHNHSLALDQNHTIATHTYTWEGGVTQLVFEPLPDTPADANDEDEIIAETADFTVARPRKPFAHFDGQEVLKHRRFFFDPHDKVAADALRRHLATMAANTRPNQRFQTYTPPTQSGEPSHRIEAMRLGLNPVYRLEYDHTQGITTLVFAKLSLATIAKINRSRQVR